jgi:hypothetical protein
VAVVLLAVGWYFLDNDEPRYKGKKLSYWLDQRSRGKTVLQPREIDESEAAIRAIGTNGFPVLVRWLRREPESETDTTFDELCKQVGLRPRRARQLSDFLRVRIFFMVMGEKGNAIVPVLDGIIADPKTSDDLRQRCQGVEEFLGTNASLMKIYF